MRFIKLSAAIFGFALFTTACDALQPRETTYEPKHPSEVTRLDVPEGVDPYFARQNLDLQGIGGLLEQADNPEEFEYLLNSPNGVNNFDYNDDGYADYISVEEFGNEYDDERGLSLFSRFGPEEILEIARIFFDRDGGMDYPGARILMAGNEDLYGDNHYYETNWLDRSLGIVNSIFDDRDPYYRSPYYYDNYPENYQVYQVVETPIYRERVVQYCPEQVFVLTPQPTITQIQIKSPYEGRTVSKAKLPKITKEQVEYKKNNSNPPAFVPVKKGHTKDVYSIQNDKPKGNPNNFDRPVKVKNENPGGWNKPNKVERIEVKPPKVNQPSFNQPKVKQQSYNPPKINQPRYNPPPRMERQSIKPPQMNNIPKQNNAGGGGNPNKGGGNPNKGGGGGGKGGGKKP